MGPNQSHHLKSMKKDQSKKFLNYYLVGRNHFEFLYVVGKGGFGKVN
jgi:hypothetical protein